MLVEDHPWDYKDFEGIIPSGYGKGTVIVWDEGKYETTEIKEKDKKAQEHSLTAQFWKGSMKFTLHGHKLKGDFLLTRLRDKGENAWYLTKIKDHYATANDVAAKNRSVLSGKTLEQVAAAPQREWQSHKPAKKEEKAGPDEIEKRLKAGKKSAMPVSVSPMLCTLIHQPFNDSAWLYEVKWDGYRIIAFIKKGKVVLKSRGNQDYTAKYPPVAAAFEQLGYDAVIDGEVVVADENNHPDFSALQNYRAGDNIAFYSFDLLWCNGYNVMSLPLTERKELLTKILPAGDAIKYSDSFDDGIELFETVKNLGIEGIVAKKRDSQYAPGRKGNTWYKAKLSLRREYVIGGWTESAKGRLFRALIFGNYVNGKLTYVNHSGGGFSDKQMKELAAKLKAIEIDGSPFVNEHEINSKTRPHWVKPVLVAEFDKSVNNTAAGRIRHPAIFAGLREDKKATDVVEEVPQAIADAGEDKPVAAEKNQTGKSHAKSDEGNWETVNKRKITSENELAIEGQAITLVNIERELWPGITKAAFIQYYIEVADYILPFMKDRPVSLHIALQSPAKAGFFLRGMEGKAPGWTQVFVTDRKHRKKGKSDKIQWMICNNKASLVYALNLEAIDLHTWTSRTSSPTNPDYIVIDLDPSDNDFKKVIETTLAAKEIFARHKLKTFVKTSGKTGMHLLIPCAGIVF